MPAAATGLKAFIGIYYLFPSSPISLPLAGIFANLCCFFACCCNPTLQSWGRWTLVGLWLLQLPMAGGTCHGGSSLGASAPLLGLPCWLGLGCLLNGESLLLPLLPHLLTPLTPLCFPERGPSLAWAGCGGSATLSGTHVQPKQIPRGFGSHKALHDGAWVLALSETAQMDQVTQTWSAGVNTLRNTLLLKP